MLNGLPWKQTKIILLFLRLQPSTAFWTLLFAVRCSILPSPAWPCPNYMDSRTLWKRSVFIPIPKKGNATECPNSAQLCSFHMLARLCSKSFKLGFSSIWTENLQMYKLGMEETEEPEIKLPTLVGSWRKQGSYIKASVSLTVLKPLTVWITTNWKILKELGVKAIFPTSWETCMQVKKQQLELDMKQLTCSKLGKEYVKVVYSHPAHLIYMQSTSWEMTSWMNHKLESRFLAEISTMCRWYHSNGRKWRGTEGPLDEDERGEWKSWLETQYTKN